VREDEPRLLHQRAAHHRRIHIRIAVAVAADPGADGEERRQPRFDAVLFLQGLLELGVKARQLVEEGEAEVGKPVRHLVRHREPRAAQHCREPQPEDLGMQGPVSLGRLLPGKKPCYFTLAIQDALALHLGRMRGENRRHARAAEPFQQCIQADAGLARAVERVGEAARAPRRARRGVRAAAPVLLLVLGDVEEMREVAERAHQVQRLLGVQGVQLALELGAGRFFLAKRHRLLADALDALERLLAHLLADHFAQQPPEQPAVFAEQQFLLFHERQRIIGQWEN
jgi:hypothetical protein